MMLMILVILMLLTTTMMTTQKDGSNAWLCRYSEKKVDYSN
jgi:hypothetical protein